MSEAEIPVSRGVFIFIRQQDQTRIYVESTEGSWCQFDAPSLPFNRSVPYFRDVRVVNLSGATSLGPPDPACLGVWLYV